MTSPDKQTSDPHGGLSASGTTADQMHPGQPGPGTTYGDPGGTATAAQETEQETAQETAQEQEQPAP